MVLRFRSSGYLSPATLCVGVSGDGGGSPGVGYVLGGWRYQSSCFSLGRLFVLEKPRGFVCWVAEKLR